MEILRLGPMLAVIMLASLSGIVAATYISHTIADDASDLNYGIRSTREPSGRQWAFWWNSDLTNYNITGTYSNDGWSTWSNATVAHNYLSWSSATVIDALTTSNGSIIVLTEQNKPNAYTFGLWIHYLPRPESSWTFIDVYTSPSTAMYAPDMAINDTDIIRIIYRNVGGTIYTKSFDFNSSTLSHIATSAGESWETLTYNQFESIKSDSAGTFWIMYGIDAGSKVNLRDYEKSKPNEAIAVPAAGYELSELVILPNDVKCYAVQWQQGSVSTGMKLVVETAPHSRSYNNMTVDATIGGSYQHQNPHVSIYFGNYIWVYWDNTVDKRLEMSGPCLYTANESTWEATKTNLESFGDNYDWVTSEGCTDLWPKVDGVSFQIPLAGYFFGVVDREKVGSVYHTDKEIKFTSTVHWPVLSGPNITTTDLAYAVRNHVYFKILGLDGGNAPFLWQEFNAPPWLHIDPANGILYGQCNETGLHTIMIRVIDVCGLEDTVTLGFPQYSTTPSSTPAPLVGLDTGCISTVFIIVLAAFFGTWLVYYTRG